jgi:hypothetical protein
MKFFAVLFLLTFCLAIAGCTKVNYSPFQSQWRWWWSDDAIAYRDAQRYDRLAEEIRQDLLAEPSDIVLDSPPTPPDKWGQPSQH